MFETQDTDKIWSSTVAELLAEMEERPWPEWRRGNPITARAIAKILKPFDVHPRMVRIGESGKRGYRRATVNTAATRDSMDAGAKHRAVHPG